MRKYFIIATLLGFVSVSVAVPTIWGFSNVSPMQETKDAMQRGGVSKMTSPNVNIIEVDEVKTDSTRLASVAAAAAAGPGPSRHRRTATLKEMNSQLDGIKVPAHLPEGFSLHESTISGQHMAEHTYFNPENRLRITVTEHLGPMSREIMRGHFRRVSVSGIPGYLITGSWVSVIKDGVASPRYWDPDAGRVLLFHMGERTYRVAVATDPVKKGFTDEDLLRVAESLVPHEDGGN